MGSTYRRVQTKHGVGPEGDGMGKDRDGRCQRGQKCVWVRWVLQCVGCLSEVLIEGGEFVFTSVTRAVHTHAMEHLQVCLQVHLVMLWFQEHAELPKSSTNVKTSMYFLPDVARSLEMSLGKAGIVLKGPSHIGYTLFAPPRPTPPVGQEKDADSRFKGSFFPAVISLFTLMLLNELNYNLYFATGHPAPCDCVFILQASIDPTLKLPRIQDFKIHAFHTEVQIPGNLGGNLPTNDDRCKISANKSHDYCLTTLSLTTSSTGTSILLAGIDAVLKPERLIIDQSALRARGIFNHWIACFDYYMARNNVVDEAIQWDHLDSLLGEVPFTVTQGATILAITRVRLTAYYVTPRNVVLARHQLLTRHQKPGESDAVDAVALDSLANKCDVRAVNVQQHGNPLKLDAFVNGIDSIYIQQRLLETEPLTYDQAVTLAKTLRSAMQSSEMLETEKETSRSAGTPKERKGQTPEKCYFCDKSCHPRQKCLARFATCSYCGKLGHFAKACKAKSTPTNNNNKKMHPGAAGMEDNCEKGESSDEHAESTS
ncbi:uncharacterized protein [Narcine bancroftii]|uniref:uncharacterized protein n=1 Tax=Narcine bancroftii TaxID=1343680 RepID=UPI003831FCBB